MLNKDIELEVQEYEFQSFSDKFDDGEVKSFDFNELDINTPIIREAHQKSIKLERTQSEVNGFDISPIVRQHRGIKKQEDVEREEAVENEVRKRVSKMEENAYKKGYEEGIEKGRQDIYEQTRAQTEEKMIILNEMINDVLSTKEEILKSQKNQLYTMLKNLSKWIVLRELKDDGNYIERLLEKLIVEAGVKSNLLIQVDQKHFEMMPDVLETIQDNLGKLTNVRVESDFDIQGTGIVLETSNGIINGSLYEQFKSLDKIFESVGVEGHHEDNLVVNDVDEVDSSDDE